MEDPREEDRGDVRERSDGGVVPTARLGAEERERGEATAKVTRCVGCDTDGREAPEHDATNAQTRSAFSALVAARA